MLRKAEGNLQSAAMSQLLPSGKPQLLAIIGVDKAKAVQCDHCRHRVWVEIHMVQIAAGVIECWGSRCWANEIGAGRATPMQPLLPWLKGRDLTDEERELLANNRVELIERFKAQKEERKRREEAAERAEAVRKAEEQDNVPIYAHI